MMAEALDAGESFTIETTLSGTTHLRTIREARERGWQIGLAYIGINSSTAALARVQERYRAGGHDIAPADVRRRYERSMVNLATAIGQTDAAILYDNTGPEGYRRVLEVRDQIITFSSAELPRWLQGAFKGHSLSVSSSL